MKVLVTGGAGFIGSHVVAALSEVGHEAVVFDRAHETARGPAHGGAHGAAQGALHGQDVRDPAALREALGGVDAVCHQAGKVGLGVDVSDFPEYASHNDVGTATVLNAMAGAGIGNLVLASSMVVYGEGTYACPAHGPIAPGPRLPHDLDDGRFEPRCPRCAGALQPRLVTESAVLDPRNAYAASKVAQEHYSRAWARETGGSVIALRYHNVYGPGLPRDTPYAGVAALFRSELAQGRSPRVFEDGGQLRDFVHVRDVAKANVLALEHARPGFQAYNVGSGEPRTIGEVAQTMARALGGPQPIVTGEYRLGDVRHITASSELIAYGLRWKAEVPFEQGIREI